MIQEVTKELAELFGLAKPSGALVTLVQKGGPAEEAGIKTKDVIMRFDGKAVSTSSDLPRIVGATKPGSKVSIQVWRNGSTKKMIVLVDEFPSDEKIASRGSKKSKVPDTSNRIGLALRELTNNEKKQLEVNSGLLVEAIRPGIASRVGIRPGDIILGINNQDAATVEQFNQLLNKSKEGRNIALLVKRGNTTSFITMQLKGGDSK